MNISIQKGTILTIENASPFASRTSIYSQLLALWVNPFRCPKWFATYFGDGASAEHLVSVISARLLMTWLNPFKHSGTIEIDLREDMPAWQVAAFSAPMKIAQTLSFCFPL